MIKPYLTRLIAIQDMLDSPLPDIVLEGYRFLFELWLSYSNDDGFSEELKKIASKHAALAQEFTNRLNDLPRTEAEKAILLKSIILLYPLEIVMGIQPIEKANEKLPKAIAPKIFISYSHKDESFKNDLIVMLAGLQRRGILDVWQDRRIEPGSNWFTAIKKAIEQCDVAVLFISPDFIASRFIQEEELADLFQRRIKDGLCVIPIIVRPCLWESEPMIKDLQALPRDAKPIISFSKENGDRDQVWTDISKAIENLAKGH